MIRKVVFLFVFVFALIECKSEANHSSIIQVKDSSNGEYVWTIGFSSYPPFGKFELFKNDRLIFTKINTTTTKYQEFKKFDNIVKVRWTIQNYGGYIYQYFFIYLHRYTLDGSHTYSNNITGNYKVKGYSQTTGSLIDSYSSNLFYEHIELQLRGYETNKIQLKKDDRSNIQFDCYFDLYNKNLTNIKLRLNSSIIFEYNAVIANSSNSYLNTGDFYVPEWLLNDRVNVQLKDNSVSFIISKVEADLNGIYYCEMFYKAPTTSTVSTLKSNLIYLTIV